MTDALYWLEPSSITDTDSDLSDDTLFDFISEEMPDLLLEDLDLEDVPGNGEGTSDIGSFVYPREIPRNNVSVDSRYTTRNGDSAGFHWAETNVGNRRFPMLDDTKNTVHQTGVPLRLPSEWSDRLDTVGVFTLDPAITDIQNKSTWHPLAKMNRTLYMSREQVTSINFFILALEQTRPSIKDVKDTDRMIQVLGVEIEQLIKGMNTDVVVSRNTNGSMNATKVKWPLNFYIHRFQKSVKEMTSGDILLAFKWDDEARESFGWLVQALRTVLCIDW